MAFLLVDGLAAGTAALTLLCRTGLMLPNTALPLGGCLCALATTIYLAYRTNCEGDQAEGR